MNGTLTIAGRELRERSFVFVTAAVISLVPFIPAVLPNPRGTSPLLVVMFVGTVAAVSFTIGLSIIMGGSIVARELADKRLSFYFSKPISAHAIWFGKVLGALSTIALCFVITLTPALLVGHSEWRTGLGLSTSGSILGLVIVSITLLLVSHAVNTAVRSRSPLLALDIALLAITVAVVWLLVRTFVVNGAVALFWRVLGSIVLVVPLIIVAGGAWQVARGRTDIRRSHRELSRFFWSAMVIVLLVAAGYVTWVFSAGPRDITIEEMSSNSRADWVAVTGKADHRADYHPTFLVDVKTGRSLRLTASALKGRSEFTRSGDAVVSITPSADMQGRGEIHLLRLNDGGSDQGTGIVASPWSVLVLSDDLRRMATFDRGILSIHDLPSKTLLASVRIPFGQMKQLFFVSDDLVRVYASTVWMGNPHVSPHEVRIYEFNVTTRELVPTGSVKATAVSMFFRANANGSTLVVNERGGADGQRMRLLDGRTGAERAVINGYSPFGVAPLRDGGVAFLESRGEACFARILDAHGSLVADIPVGSKGMGGVLEAVPGSKYIAAVLRGAGARNGKGWDLYVVDAQRGTIDRVEHGLVMRSQIRGDDPRYASAVAGEYILVDAQNMLWRWNALTGAKVKVL